MNNSTYINDKLVNIVDTDTLYSDDNNTYSTLYLEGIHSFNSCGLLNIKVRVFDELVYNENYEWLKYEFNSDENFTKIFLRHPKMRL